MADDRLECFFYGLFMDSDVLRENGVTAMAPRKAYAQDYSLRIGARAALVPSPGHRAYGMIFALTEAELQQLYSAPGLQQYRAETIAVSTFGGELLSVRCYNLPVAPEAGERNPQYVARLRSVLTKLGFPSEYVATVV